MIEQSPKFKDDLKVSTLQTTTDINSKAETECTLMMFSETIYLILWLVTVAK